MYSHPTILQILYQGHKANVGQLARKDQAAPLPMYSRPTILQI
jgi:hypothetical protein